MKNIFKTRWFIFLLIFAVTGALATMIFRLLTPAQPVVPKTEFITTNYSESSTAFNNIRFSGSFVPSAIALPPAVVQASQTTFDFVRSQIIEDYGLQLVVGVPNLWRGETHVFSYNSIGDEYIFYSIAAAQSAEPLLREPTRAIRNAETFVQATFPNLSLSPQQEKIMYLGGESELVETDRNSASIIEIPFVYTVQGVPVYVGHERTAPVTVIVDSSYEVQRTNFQPYFLTITPLEQSLPLISLDVALENINTRNEASVISAFEPETGVFTLEEAVSGELKTVRLEYRADLEQGIAYPFYRFSGELVNQDGQVINAEIITPAVAVQE